MHNTPSRIRPAFLGQIILRLDDAGKVLGRYRVAAIGEDDPSGGPAPAPMPPGCTICGGTGFAHAWVRGGPCFACNGTGLATP